MQPYYDHDGITIYHGDCREVLPSLPEVDLVLTDPPYPGFDQVKYTPIINLEMLGCRQFVFWPAKLEFPFSFTARHVWHKPNGRTSEHYEFVYERNGQAVCRVWRVPIIQYETLPEWTPHPTQKPLKLMNTLIQLAKPSLILDPYMGSGSTLEAAKNLRCGAIGIEIEEKYCEVAAKRLAQEVLPFAI